MDDKKKTEEEKEIIRIEDRDESRVFIPHKTEPFSVKKEELKPDEKAGGGF